MTRDELKQALDELGWNQSEFARKAGLVPNTVSRWVAGEVPIPRWAEQYLGMALEIQRLHKKYVLPERLKE